jgi:hypothetical protein
MCSWGGSQPLPAVSSKVGMDSSVCVCVVCARVGVGRWLQATMLELVLQVESGRTNVDEVQAQSIPC